MLGVWIICRNVFIGLWLGGLASSYFIPLFSCFDSLCKVTFSPFIQRDGFQLGWWWFKHWCSQGQLPKGHNKEAVEKLVTVNLAEALQEAPEGKANPVLTDKVVGKLGVAQVGSDDSCSALLLIPMASSFVYSCFFFIPGQGPYFKHITYGGVEIINEFDGDAGIELHSIWEC